MHAAHPSTALGSGVLSGPSAKDLAFLAGRHLTYYRPEYHVLLYYPTREGNTLTWTVTVNDPDVLLEPWTSTPRVAVLNPNPDAMMPEGLLNSFKEDEIVDLAAFLFSRGDRSSKMFRQMTVSRK